MTDFDEKKFKAEVDRLFREGDITGWGYLEFSGYFARWQFRQDRAKYQKAVEALRRECCCTGETDWKTLKGALCDACEALRELGEEKE